MKFVLALLGAALAGECEWDDTAKEYKSEDCTVPACDSAIDDPHEGCTPADCTDKDTPYKGCEDIPCDTAKDSPYDGCVVGGCEENDDKDEYETDKPYEGCVIPVCDGDDDKHKNCVEVETVYCEFDTEKGGKEFIAEGDCVDPCDADRDEDDMPAECAEGSSTGLIIVLVLAAVGGLAGAFYCKHQKKACFKEKPEGGKFESLI